LKSQNFEIAILLQQCKENNQKAQLALYNMYCSAMFNVAFRIVSDKTLAEDTTKPDTERAELINIFNANILSIETTKNVSELYTNIAE
jgi:hypothetical protein